MSEESEFDCGEDVLEEEDLCDYTGDPCVGDKMFCEECPVFQELDAENFKELMLQELMQRRKRNHE